MVFMKNFPAMSHFTKSMRSKVNLKQAEEVKKCQLKLYAFLVSSTNKEWRKLSQNLKGPNRDRQKGKMEGGGWYVSSKRSGKW